LIEVDNPLGGNYLKSAKDASSLRKAPNDLPDALRNVVEYRKSGLSLNHVVGCPLDCGYCVRHLFNNFDMKRPHLVCDDETAVEALITHWAFQPNVTPIQIFNRATDPFLPGVKEHLFATLEILDKLELRNHLLIITRWKVEQDDVDRLERLSHLQVTVLVTWSGIEDARIEPIDSGIAERSLAELARHSKRTRRILYWRPIVAGLNDTDEKIVQASELSRLADATVFTGLFHREQIREYLRSVGVADLYSDAPRRKVMPRAIEARVISKFSGANLFRKTSCAVAFAHGKPDWNGHYGIDKICEICPANQVEICSRAHRRPDRALVEQLASAAGLSTNGIEIDSGYVSVENSTEQQRYYMQHTLGFQVHDKAMPHMPGRHGRAEEGWE
jgi:DNA repair photolyase